MLQHGHRRRSRRRPRRPPRRRRRRSRGRGRTRRCRGRASNTALRCTPVPVISSPKPQVARRGDLADRHLLVGRALHVDHAVLDVEVGGVDLHRLTGDLEHLLLGLLGGLEHREPADEGAARGERARAERRGVGVRDVHVDRLVGHAERVGHDLRVHGLGALAEVDGAGEDVDAPVGLDLDPGLRRVAALVHAGGVLDRGEAASTMLHRAASWGSPSFASASWSTRCGGSHSPERSSFFMSR